MHVRACVRNTLLSNACMHMYVCGCHTARATHLRRVLLLQRGGHTRITLTIITRHPVSSPFTPRLIRRALSNPPEDKTLC